MIRVTKRHRVTLARALGDLAIARGSVRGVYWAECTHEAEPLRQLARSSASRLESASRRLHAAMRLSPATGAAALVAGLHDLESAWSDTHAALDAWQGVPEQLVPGDSALAEVRAILTEIGGAS